ncbi:NADH:ubiquinone reductase (Na(+)-transporting) subunit C [Tranquillimonas alkanivorans]|uniref:Na(+)-translocating NADH-quinone reductase subunit C n=1 Tax=Tranquillimonas alkanivorans TaxID=441119 RepID=A0A1I5U3F9_9RHOB|nr:NADH:ubiquinone reductase (Na(+)-transporting) subunit C [Tranquillimonas alkanivorans]SFP89823.1 Na+-transporting NADH:ubiquinone oxidoreductase subunit C [Tranquillimonas alkanivorans]
MSEPRTAWGRFLARPNDDRTKTLGIAFLTAFISALVVSTTSIALKPLQDANIAAEQAARMDAMLDALPGLRALMEETGVTALETRLVDLDAGDWSDADPTGYDFAAAFTEPEASTPLPPEADIAGLGNRPVLAPVHLLEREGELMLIVLPMAVSGYASTIRAMLALEPDLNTVAALSITEQGETPGLGARIEDPAWQAQWPGKEVTNDAGEIVFSVVRGQASGPHEVDAISGATRTSNAIHNMMRFWMGEWGYGPFLDRLEEEGL